MGIKQSSIVINGKRYDAHTGKPLSHSEHAPKPAAKPARPINHDVIRQSATAKHVHKTVERSKTLMRHAVKRPAKLVAPKVTSAKVMADIMAPAKTIIAPVTTLLHHQQDIEREKRAQKIRQSSLVRKFNDGEAPPGLRPITKKVQPLAVQPAPANIYPVAKNPVEKMIEKGLRAAQSHNEPVSHNHKKSRSKRSKRAKLASVGAGGMAVLLLTAFFAFQNVPNISMRYAAAKAGVSAQLPGYRPSGFALSNHIQYNPGQITLSFKSNSDNRNFTIVQRASNWNSETLMNNYVASASDQFQTFEDKGRKIYLYGDSNATWVNGGVWYEINGNSQLNSDQLIRIATSM